VAFQAFRNLKTARFDLSRSGLAASTGATAPVALGLGRACVHVGPHRSHYRTPLMVDGESGPAGARRSRHRHQGRGGTLDVRPMVDSSAAEVLARLNRAYIRRPVLTFALGMLCTLALTQGIALGSGVGAMAVFAVAAAVVLWFVYDREREHYSEPVDYALDRDAAEAYRRLLRAFRRLATSGPVWRIDTRRRTSDGRRVERRYPAVPKLALPPRVLSNLRVPVIHCGRQTLYFFPDRLLVYESQMVWGVFYDELQVKAGDVREIADQPFGEGEEALNGFIAFGSDAGLSELFRCVDPAGAIEVAAALRQLA
jgi:hypothetical protein